MPAPHGTRTGRRQRGFTLIEIMVVVVILSVLAVIVAYTLYTLYFIPCTPPHVVC